MQIAGMVVALDEWMSMDHDQRLADTARMLKVIEDRLEGVPGVRTEQVAGFGYADLTLLIVIGPDAARTAEQAIVELEVGHPSIKAGPAAPDVYRTAPGEGTIQVRPFNIHEGEEVIARRAPPPDTPRLIRGRERR